MEYLNRKKRLPKVNKSANFLAFSSSTGMYRKDNMKHRIPKNKHIPKPKNRCVLLCK